MPEPRITDVMQAHAQDAVNYARARFHYRLDFTGDSVERVDRMLDAMYHDIPRTFLARTLRKGPNEEQVWNVSKMIGGYVGEVIRRQWGGRWKTTPNPDGGHALIFLDVLGEKVEPVEIALHRLREGKVSGERAMTKLYRRVLKQARAAGHDEVGGGGSQQGVSGGGSDGG